MNRKGSVLLSALLVTSLVAVSSGILSTYSLKKDLVDKYGSGGGIITPTNLSNSVPVLPANQVVYSDGAGLIGNSNLTFNGVTLTVLNASTTGQHTFGSFISSASSTVAGAFNVSGLTTLTNASTTQLGSTGSSYFATGGGNVGIGTTTPGATFAVQGNALIAGTTTVRSLIATSTTLSAVFNGTVNIGTAANLVPDVLLFGDSLNVGGGVDLAAISPTFRMEDEGIAADYRTFDITNSSGQLTIRGIDSTGNSTSNAIVITKNAGTYTIASTTFPNGVVGIGTTTPGAKFAVHGDALIAGTTTVRALVATSSSLTVGGSNFVVDASGNVGIGTSNPISELHVNSIIQAGTNGVAHGLLHSPGILYLGIDSNNDSTTQFLVVQKNSASVAGSEELFRIQEDGNVGIGTSSPASLLSVEGTATTTAYINSTTGGSGSGIQLKSPDGAYYCVYVANGGTLTTAPGACK